MTAMRRRAALFALSLLALAAMVLVFRAREPKASVRPTMTVLQALGPGPHDDQFARATGPREFHFPADHGPHPEFRNEWWYWTGNLTASTGRAFGYELTIFRTALAPDQPSDRTSAWAPRDVYMAHFTISDIAGHGFYAFERTSRAALDLAGSRAAPFRAWVLDWSASSPDSASAAHRGADAAARDSGAIDAHSDDSAAVFPFRLRAQDGPTLAPFALDLTLEQGKPIVLEGDRGFSRKGAESGNASYYYSLTRMPTTGTVTVAGERFEIQGESWMDREWSTRALSSDQIGWHWFALRLDDGREVMVYELLRRDGRKDPWSSGTLIERDGTSHPLRAADVTIEPRGTWTSPHSHVPYPAAFRLAIPGSALDVQVTPLLPDQELDLTFRYWEGAVRVEGKSAENPITGRGYLELTGYGDDARQPR
jgi:predicted secreted hydrolase